MRTFSRPDNGSTSSFKAGSYGNKVGLSAYVGGRYLFTNSLGVFAELGYGVSYLILPSYHNPDQLSNKPSYVHYISFLYPLAFSYLAAYCSYFAYQILNS